MLLAQLLAPQDSAWGAFFFLQRVLCTRMYGLPAHHEVSLTLWLSAHDALIGYVETV